jgi:hypothetical protein
VWLVAHRAPHLGGEAAGPDRGAARTAAPYGRPLESPADEARHGSS